MSSIFVLVDCLSRALADSCPRRDIPRVRDSRVMWTGLLGGADALVRGRPPGRPLLW